MEPFSERLLRWWRESGRHDLPWQYDRSPYSVWVSEIMLQQTQVSTVVDYFNRFMDAFPTLTDLASAELDHVLSLWAGLGYYARARNLHKTAEICQSLYGGTLPKDAEALVRLPGIGLSTAHAILAQAYNQRAPILDGNVKRVLARHKAIQGWPGQAAVQRRLWALADHHTPTGDAANYTQAIMDLGALVCTRRQPHCDVCPVASDCQAHQTNQTETLPTPKPQTKKRHWPLQLNLYYEATGAVLLEKRPERGIWGGLWCLPEAARSLDLEIIEIGPQIKPFTHLLTHRIVILTVHCARVKLIDLTPYPDLRWVQPAEVKTLGLPKPIQTLLHRVSLNNG